MVIFPNQPLADPRCLRGKLKQALNFTTFSQKSLNRKSPYNHKVGHLQNRLEYRQTHNKMLIEEYLLIDGPCYIISHFTCSWYRITHILLLIYSLFPCFEVTGDAQVDSGLPLYPNKNVDPAP